ncbi:MULTISPECIES: hypothetical protein [unclassified Mesobacillus]|jgi:hypothetical protein|uniref:hypothetical protein n=1 Tax=unclassified Mesobacillus TaxID=2675270 RepID=UPI0020421943|nr:MULTISPECIES: hypothetical protein [unclassified Mesobacillus]MCM3123329.1 hypothetical protein [Mesobacillus sp. MER 33]MCM3233188.1 hypothetical protein [Mesobacillus sp. MER 48]
METGALKSLFNQKTTQQTKITEFRPGQIINGKIIKLFPDQVAEVQIGNQKMVAQLEVPLSANERYWFQVQPGEGKVHLKLISSSADEKGQPGNLTRILSEFGLQPTKENLDLVRFFIKEQLPVNGELLKLASEWLKTVESRTAGEDAIKMLLTRGMPVTKAAFEALYTATKEQSLVMIMEQLGKSLEAADESDTIVSLRRLLNELLPTNKTISSAAALNHLASAWLGSNGKHSEAALDLLQQYGAIPAKSSENNVLQQLLSNLQNLDGAEENLPEALRFLKTVLTLIEKGDSFSARQIMASSINDKSFPINDVADSLHFIFDRANGKNTNAQTGLLAFKQLLSHSNASSALSLLLAGKADWEQAGLKLLEAAGRQQQAGTVGVHAQLLSEAAGKAEPAPVLQEHGLSLLSDVKIKRFLSALGLSYEYQLSEAMKDGEAGRAQVADTLKSLTLRLLNENPPQTVKDAAEPLVNKLTGFQLLSQEAGPIQQLVVQVPIILGGKTSELSMQWSGKRTEDGKIDADFCRVLFYLKLQYLDDTIIDMQVQNRVMSIQIFNDQPDLKKMAEQMTPILKTKLSELEYKLSSVHFHVPGESNGKSNQRNLSELYGQKEYYGVDIKI